MIGIYKYENRNNHHIYIGQSVDINKRLQSHLWSAYNANANDYNTQLHKAIRKYGIDAFDITILQIIQPDEYSQELLNNLEKYYIQQYNSFHNGYNSTEGGDVVGNNAHYGSNNGRALLNEEDVKYIRECYNAHIPFKQVYQEYQDKISKRGLQKIWWFDTWKNIYPEYHNEENKKWHSHQAKANSSEVAAQNTRAFSPDIVRKMRQEYAEGNTPKAIWLKYAPERAWSSVYNILIEKTYKNIK